MVYSLMSCGGKKCWPSSLTAIGCLINFSLMLKWLLKQIPKGHAFFNFNLDKPGLILKKTFSYYHLLLRPPRLSVQLQTKWMYKDDCHLSQSCVVTQPDDLNEQSGELSGSDSDPHACLRSAAFKWQCKWWWKSENNTFSKAGLFGISGPDGCFSAHVHLNVCSCLICLSEDTYNEYSSKINKALLKWAMVKATAGDCGYKYYCAA